MAPISRFITTHSPAWAHQTIPPDNRGGELIEELPLARVENQPYIHYRKGTPAENALIPDLFERTTFYDIQTRPAVIPQSMARPWSIGCPPLRPIDLQTRRLEPCVGLIGAVGGGWHA